MQTHRKLTLLLNLLLAGSTTFQPPRHRHFWALVKSDDKGKEFKWVPEFYFAKFGKLVIDDLSSAAINQLEEVESDQYYSVIGHDGQGLCVPGDLDDSICRYLQLSPTDRAAFNRATFWMNVASRQWTISVSSSFASLVSAIESLIDRGVTHQARCNVCNVDIHHEMPGATERFRRFFERFAPGAAMTTQRTKMYELRSGILHGSKLMQLDQDIAFGWDPPYWNERELHDDLWTLTGLAMRNWLKEKMGASERC